MPHVKGNYQQTEDIKLMGITNESHTQMDTINVQVQDILKENLVEPLTSPLLLIPKGPTDFFFFKNKSFCRIGNACGRCRRVVWKA